MTKENNKETLQRGFFPVRVSVVDRKGDKAADIVGSFVKSMELKHNLQVMEHADGASEAVIAVPFADKELLRIDFNLFASETEEEYGDSQRFRFTMESVWEQS